MTALLCTLAVPTYATVAPSSRVAYLAGSGGVPGGRETGRYIQANVPEGASDARDRAVDGEHPRVLRPSTRLRALGQPEPLHRNPIYQAVPNPDLSLRRGDIQYIVWDAFSARRSAHFERRLLSYVSRYRGRAVYTFSTPARAKRRLASHAFR